MMAATHSPNSILIGLACTLFICTVGSAQGPYQATGIKIGEVTEETAIIWTRLTRRAERIGTKGQMPEIRYRDPETGKLMARTKGRPDLIPDVRFPAGATIHSIEGAVPGESGQVRVLYRASDTSPWKETNWHNVETERDYTCQLKLTHLKPDTEYRIRVETRKRDGEKMGQVVNGRFRTAPPADQPAPVTFTVSTGQAYPDQDATGGGFKIYPTMLKLNPDFFVHTGDILYYDKMAKTLPLARWHWQRMYSLPTNVEFHRQVNSYFIKDDHDTWMNDCWPGMKTKFMGDFTLAQGQQVFLEQVPMGEHTWRTFRWGKDLQIWLVEGRDFRSPNTMPDGPNKTIWGGAQKAWFKRTVQQSNATFRILISPTPLVGPDRTNKNDNHANTGFAHEGNELREFISKQENMVVICGDRHWQYVSVDKRTGLREYSCGPASNEHAGGWSNDKRFPEHRYLNVTGGFLAVHVNRSANKPNITFIHYSVDGDILHKDVGSNNSSQH
jgi:alkaline phosphatase D